ncbi:tetratricopeptide repeat protein, partial [Patescibacteria group bacterium]
GALEIWKHSPILGSGVETFAYTYYNFRPLAHNEVTEWDFLYNKAHNEYLNFLATTGVVGLGSYLLLICSYLFWVTKQIPNSKSSSPKKNHNSLFTIHYSLLAGFVTILITNFFGFSVVVIGLLFFLIPALSVALILKKPKTPSYSKKITFKQKRQLLLLAFFCLSLISFPIRFWIADLYYARADKAFSDQEFQAAFENITQAINLKPREAEFHDDLALTAASLAQLAFQQDEKNLTEELTQLATSQSDLTLKLNQYHLNYWKNRTRVLLRLADIDSKYRQKALDSLLRATLLAPTDAKITYNLALIYDQLDQRQTAIQTLKKAIEQKDNYQQARFALALYLYEEGQTPEAIEQLTYIIEKINPTDEAIKQLIEDWEKKSR